MRYYYVFLMADRNVVAKRATAPITDNEKESVDCWRVDAKSLQDAISAIFNRLYESQKQLAAAKSTTMEYYDPNAQAVHDVVKQAVSKHDDTL